MIYRALACLFGLLHSPTSFASGAGAPILPQNPFVYENAIYVSTNGVSRYGRADTRAQWRALPDINTFEPVATADLVLVGSGGGLYALDSASGDIRWHAASDLPIFSPLVSGGTVYAAAQDGVLRAMALEDGREIWSRRFEGWLYPPALDEGVLIVGGSAARVYGVDAVSAAVIWSKTVSQELVYRPVLGLPGQVLVTTFAGDLYAMASATGRTLWRTRETAAAFPPLVRDGRLYMGAFDGSLRARNLADGGLVWIRSVAEKLPYMPYVHANQILVASEGGSITALDLHAGEILWRRELRLNVTATPVVVGDRLIVATDNGVLSVHSMPEDPRGDTDNGDRL